MSGIAIGGAGEAGGDVVPLALLAGYKVRWDRRTVARNVVQNFFDAAEDFGDVRIDTETPGRVRVEGPATFDMEYLRYIGATSKRDTRAAGGFGEGFKICALVLLRDYGVGLRAGSGPWEIRPFFRPMKLGRELCYEVVRHAPSRRPVRELGGDHRSGPRALRGVRRVARLVPPPGERAPLEADLRGRGERRRRLRRRGRVRGRRLLPAAAPRLAAVLEGSGAHARVRRPHPRRRGGPRSARPARAAEGDRGRRREAAERGAGGDREAAPAVLADRAPGPHGRARGGGAAGSAVHVPAALARARLRRGSRGGPGGAARLRARRSRPSRAWACRRRPSASASWTCRGRRRCARRRASPSWRTSTRSC